MAMQQKQSLGYLYTSLQIIVVSKQVICPARVGQNMFFHHVFTQTGIVAQ